MEEKENNEDYYINVLLKEKKFRIYCGDGRQKLRWLTDVSILKYDRAIGGKCGKYIILYTIPFLYNYLKLIPRCCIWHKVRKWEFIWFRRGYKYSTKEKWICMDINER